MTKERTASHTLPIAVVVSRFNAPVTDKLRQACLARLTELGFSADQVTVIDVPGAIELPLMARALAAAKKVQAVIALGVVIRGESDHYDYVCQAATQGCQQVALTYGLPVIFGVLTTHTAAQAMARADGTHSDKGRYCAEAAVEMVGLLQDLTT
jgi:6,7-dimethyl-8-ribityllumazine synthase